MQLTTKDIKAEFHRDLDAMRTLRDEIRVKLHLAKLDAKDEWNLLEPQLAAIDHAADEFSEATYKKLNHVMTRLTALKASILS
jgi:hypothetical protein